jgi:hypothetical protein
MQARYWEQLESNMRAAGLTYLLNAHRTSGSSNRCANLSGWSLPQACSLDQRLPSLTVTTPLPGL